MHRFSLRTVCTVAVLIGAAAAGAAGAVLSWWTYDQAGDA